MAFTSCAIKSPLIDPIDHYQHQLVKFSTKSHDEFNNEFLELMIDGSMQKIWVATQCILYVLLGLRN